MGVGSGGGWSCCRIVEENEGWSVRGMIEIRVRLRTNVACKEMMLVRNELLIFLNIISKLL